MRDRNSFGGIDDPALMDQYVAVLKSARAGGELEAEYYAGGRKPSAPYRFRHYVLLDHLEDSWLVCKCESDIESDLRITEVFSYHVLRTKAGKQVTVSSVTMPYLGQDVLVWKHVTEFGVGNRGYPYQVGKRFRIPPEEQGSMGCSGPFGAIRNWCGDDTNPHVLAIRTPATRITRVLAIRTPTRPIPLGDDGVFEFDRGLPVALYRAEDITPGGMSLRLQSGTDVLPLLSSYSGD